MKIGQLLITVALLQQLGLQSFNMVQLILFMLNDVVYLPDEAHAGGPLHLLLH